MYTRIVVIIVQLWLLALRYLCMLRCMWYAYFVDTNRRKRTMLTGEQVAKRVGVSRRTLFNWLAEGRFPEARVINGRRAGWSVAVVDAWVKENVK